MMGALMPDLEKAGEGADDGYEGAIVLPPKCAMYFDNPVACNDFASLYPSIAEAYNLCPQSLVWTKTFDLEGNQTSFVGCAPPRKTRGGSVGKVGRYGGSSGGELVGEHYDEEVGYKYVDVEFDIFEFRRKTPKGKAVKTKTGTKICRWAQFPDGKKSIVPAIIHELLTARNDTKAQMKKESDMFMKNVLDKRQLGLKVTANSLYGQFGSKTSPFFQKDVAASITAIGRKMIIYVKGMVEELYSNRLVEVPAIYSEKGYVAGVTMEKMRCRAEYVYGDSVANYTPVYVRVLCEGVHEVFDICTIEELACRYGGNLWVHCREEGKQDKEFCELSDVCVETWTEAGWTRLYRVIRHMLASHKKMIRVLTHTGLVDVTDDHSLLGLDGKEISPKEVGIGSELLHSDLPSWFGDFTDNVWGGYENNYVAKFKTMLEAARYYVYLRKQNKGYYLDYDLNGFYYVILQANMGNQIQKMCEIPYEGYVYDLTTENHHFAAGVGNMIVHNTDSVFFTFNLEDALTGDKIRGKRALEVSIGLAQEVARLCSIHLPPPMKLAYEKTLMNFCLLSKKRYVGMLYETDPNEGHLKYMGLALKRRDVCDYVKDVYGQLVMIFKEGSSDTIVKACKYLCESLEALVEGRVPMDKLLLSKALRSYYKNPDSIAHSVLAERIAKRDPGNRPKPGDRVRFGVVEWKAMEVKRLLVERNRLLPPEKARKTLMMGDRIETPEFMIDKNLRLDYAYYIEKQLLNPIKQLFGLILEPILEYKGRGREIAGVRRDLEALRETSGNDLEDYMDKREKYCTKRVEELLFSEYMIRIRNRKNGVSELTNYFMPVKN
jgi:DNA polymerase elongation subunit (family B)